MVATSSLISLNYRSLQSMVSGHSVSCDGKHSNLPLTCCASPTKIELYPCLVLCHVKHLRASFPALLTTGRKCLRLVCVVYKCRKKTRQIERLQEENTSEWGKRERLETEKLQLERENKRLKTNCDELKAEMERRRKTSAEDRDNELRQAHSQLRDLNEVTLFFICWVGFVVSSLRAVNLKRWISVIVKSDKVNACFQVLIWFLVSY